MSLSNIEHKRIGYFAAMQLFRGESDLLMLTTNLIKKVSRDEWPLTEGP